MRTAIIYHRVDWDGYTAAAVAKIALPDEAELIGWNYGDDEPCVSNFDRVIVVDLSLSESWMLANASKLTWIDHHKNMIESLQTNPVLWSVPGLRRDGIGACALAWEYFFPGEDVPMHIRLVATADVMDYTNQLILLKLALSYMLSMDEYGPGYDPVVKLDQSKGLVRQAESLIVWEARAKWELKNGEYLEEQRALHETALFAKAKQLFIQQDGIPYHVCKVDIDGRPNACILNHLMDQTHEAFICVGDFLADKGKHKISVRVPRNSDFDAAAFCRQYGGNGHIKAAGCLMSKEEIESLL